MQVVLRPAIREPLPEVRRFALLSSQEAASGEHAAEQAAGAASACRWTVPAGGAVDTWLSFQSQDVGVFQQTITFEVLACHIHRCLLLHVLNPDTSSPLQPTLEFEGLRIPSM